MTITGTGTIRVDEDIRITNVKLLGKIGESYEEYNSRYSKDKISMFVVLPSNTTITYEVETLYQFDYNEKTYDAIDLYNKDDINRLHIQLDNWFSSYYALMVEYVLGYLY